MLRENIEKKLQEIIVRQLNIEVTEFKHEAKLQDDLGADSLDGIELVMELEEEFDIEIEDSYSIKRNMTVKEIIDYLDSKIN